MTTSAVPFNQRFGVGLLPMPLHNDVPDSARIGLINILESLCDDKDFTDWGSLAKVALYAARQERDDFRGNYDETCKGLVKAMEWHRFYIFCERVYARLHGAPQWDDNGNRTGYAPPDEAQRYFTDELNQLLAEEGLDYAFVDGQFQRRGRPQTQKNQQRVGAVLTDARYFPARHHYNKAVEFFNKRPEPDVENCAKEALCALEAFAEILFGDKAAKGFEKTLRARQGNEESQIPPALVEGMIRLKGFRGDAKGVAHAHLEGGHVSIVEAELVLSLSAAYMTYLHDKSQDWLDPIPF